VATTFAQHEPNRAFMGRGGEIHSHPKSGTYKYQGAVGGYPDCMAQHLSRVLLSTFGIDAMSTCCTLPASILGTYPMTFGTSVYIFLRNLLNVLQQVTNEMAPQK
jgi:hypothetical protein